MSITGDTAKILVFNSRGVVHFHLKTHPTQGKNETRPLGRGIHPTCQTHSPYNLVHLLVWRQDEPPQLNSLGRSHVPKGCTGSYLYREDLKISLFLGGKPQVHA